jgi:membrane protein YqaA with SNARE-associated domain
MEHQPEQRGIYQWILSHVNARYAYHFFFSLFALEIILFIPLDPVMAFFAIHRKKDAYVFTVLAVLGSMLGSAIGYFLGSFLWDIIGRKIVLFLISQLTLDNFILNYQSHYFKTIFLGALFPFPFKLLTVSAGLAKIPVSLFVGIIGLARVVRFFAITYVSVTWGDHFMFFIKNYQRHILFLLALMVLIVLACYLLVFR